MLLFHVLRIVKQRKLNENGIVLYYSNQCPHTEKYALILKKIANFRVLM